MVISDLNIICIGQSYPNVYQSDLLSISYCKNKAIKGNTGFYLDDWQVIRYIKGFWYYIIPRKREECNYDDEFFDYSSNKVIISKSKIKFINEIERMINYYLESSPINQIGVLIRLFYTKKEKVKGILTKKDFIEKLYNNKIRFDTLYIIKE